MRCQDTYLYARSWIYEQSLICYFLNIVLVYPVRCQIGGTEGRDRAGQRAEISKNRRAARREKSFLRAFSDFFKKLLRVQNPCFRLFSPVLRTPTRACVFIIFEKNRLKNFFEKGVDKGVHPRYNGDTPRGYTPRPPDSVEGRADSPNGVHLVNSRSPRGQHSADRRRV